MHGYDRICVQGTFFTVAWVALQTASSKAKKQDLHLSVFSKVLRAPCRQEDQLKLSEGRSGDQVRRSLDLNQSWETTAWSETGSEEWGVCLCFTSHHLFSGTSRTVFVHWKKWVAGAALPSQPGGSLGTETLYSTDWNEVLCLLSQGCAGQPGLCHGGCFLLSPSPVVLMVLAALLSCTHAINQTWSYSAWGCFDSAKANSVLV